MKKITAHDEIDIVMKKIGRDHSRFADLYNSVLLAGNAWLDPDSLAESDKEELIVNQNHPSYRSIRDLSMTGRIHIRSGKSFKAILGLEFIKGNESDYMIQMMKRDTCNMERQYHMDPSRGLRKEFLPIINLGVWLNNTPYYAVQSINERICSTALETVGNLINDYRTNILIPALTDDSIFRSMKTEYRELFLYIKHQSDPDVLIKMAENGDFRPLQGEIIEAVNLITGSQLPVPKKGEVIDMCRGFDIIQQRAETKGMERGLQKGLQEGITLGRMKGTYQILLKELRLGLLKMEDVLMLTGDTQEEFQKKMQMLFPEETLPASY